MGVHGLTTLLQTSGILSRSPGAAAVRPPVSGDSSDADDGNRNGPAEAPPPTATASLPAILAVDGSGLAFRAVRNAHVRACARAASSSAERRLAETKTGAAGDGTADGDAVVRDEADEGTKAKSSARATTAATASLLPTMIPLRDVDREVNELLSRLLPSSPSRDAGGGGGVERVDVYFDGPNQPMKAAELKKRRMRREEEWENMRRFCVNGALPPGCDDLGGGAKKRRRRRRKRRGKAAAAAAAAGHANGSAALDSGEANSEGAIAMEAEIRARTLSESYLSSFPLSRLSLLQVRSSLERWARRRGPSRLRIIDCAGEADGDVALASANDLSGRTLAVGKDSDYLIYGADVEPVDGMGEVQYLPFDVLESCLGVKDIIVNADSLCSASFCRSHVAAVIGLPDSNAMIELSIVLGNDYTGPYLRHDNVKKRKTYRKSLHWFPSQRSQIDGDANEEGEERADDEWPDIDWNDTHSIVEHVASACAAGRRLASKYQDLQASIEYSRAQYGLHDEHGANSLPDDWILAGAAEDDDDDNILYAGIGKAIPKVPMGMDLSLTEMASKLEGGSGGIRDAALHPLECYVTVASSDAKLSSSVQLEPRHLDAFRTVLDAMKRLNTGGDTSLLVTAKKLDWNDVRTAYIVERCIAAAVRCNRSVSIEAGEEKLEPRHLFDMVSYHAALEALTYEDFPLDNEVVGQREKSFVEDFIDKSAAAEVSKEEQRDETVMDTAVEAEDERYALPIDSHEEEILEAVRTRRVTIIHGETGCGKSSRVPVMLLRAPVPEPTAAARETKMFISQPRRIAAKSLAERVRSTEPDLRSKIALRMGHGVREYESLSTRAWFVTTGYLVRLLANHPENFVSHTHLIIDEVHERSVDTDVLCLLCRRLLNTHPTLRLVLMSATMAAELYAQYFGSPEPPIHVGARRYPIREYFIEDLVEALHLGPKDARACRDVEKECADRKCRIAPSNSHMGKLYRLATQITLSVGSHGSSVLIFVPGMADIESITVQIEELNVPGVVHTCLPIHSDIPFEEQMLAFDPPGPGEVKVILATNAAESSVTLPDVDHVICFGLCKQIVYNPSSHRQMLQPTWISRASATQRAGRTGRVREGNVYRLYSRGAYTEYMAPFEAGEIVRIPLDSVILSLREMLNEEVTPVLLGCLEPPDMCNISRSFQSLHESKFLSEPNDEGEITALGSLVVSLGVDLTIGALVGLGIQFGVAPEAIQMAAILSFPRTPWIMTNPLYHEAMQFNEITSKTFVSRSQFDAGLYSEPFAIMNLLYDYSHSANKERFCRKFSVSSPRLRQLVNTADSLRRRVAAKLFVSHDSLCVDQPPKRMCHAKLTVLRVLKLWAFSDSIITSGPTKSKKAQRPSVPYCIALDGPEINEEHFGQVLSRDRHPHTLISRKKIIHTGKFTPIGDQDYDWNSFRTYFMSFATETGFSMAWYSIENSIQLFVAANVWERSQSLQRVVSSLFGGTNFDIIVMHRSVTKNRRGRNGRACGAWYESIENVPNGEATSKLLMFSAVSKKKRLKEMKKLLDVAAMDCAEATKHLSCTIVLPSNQKKNPQTSFVIFVAGLCQEVSRVDICDLFATPEVSHSVVVNPSSQIIAFDETSHHEGERAGLNMTIPRSGGTNGDIDTSCPLLEDIPEGARLLSVLASERRREHFIRFPIVPRDGDAKVTDAVSEEDNFIDVGLPIKETKISRRWRRIGTSGGAVYVAENCIPAAAISTTGSMELFACCANTLEVKGGGVRVEGITLLPPGRIFTALAFLSFGYTPFTSTALNSEEEKKVEDEGHYLMQEILAWIQEGKKFCVDKEHGLSVNEISSRIALACEFNTSCYDLGERLVCHPDKVIALCRIFDEVDGCVIKPWDSLRADSFEELCISNSAVESCAAELSKLSLAADATRETSTRSKKRKYLCLSCAQIWSKWSKCRIHMKMCCPELTLSYDEYNLMEKSAAATDGRGETANVDNTPACAAPLAKKSYGCIECGANLSRWGQCLDHMKSCCPGRLKNRKGLQQRCRIGHANCVVPEMTD